MNLDYYIDIHSHILPGVDDGSKNMEETKKMLYIAYEQGIQKIVATPHFRCGRENPSVEYLQQIRNQVQEEAVKINKDFKIYLGNELFYSENILEKLLQKEALTLAGSRYVLVEFSIDEEYKKMYHSFQELIHAGYAPILAHVERYHCFKKDENRIRELIQLGIYIQMNSKSLLGGFFDSTVTYNKKLIKQGMVHMISTDCHNCNNRPPLMKQTIGKMIRKIDDSLLEQLFYDNPAKILSNQYI